MLWVTNRVYISPHLSPLLHRVSRIERDAGERPQQREGKVKIGGIGYTFKVWEQKGNGGATYSWYLKHFGRDKGAGVEVTQKAAEKAVWECFREVSSANVVSSERRKLIRLKLRNLTEKRPYLVAGCIDLILNAKGDLERLLREAEETEKHWWKQDDPKMRVPLPTHHLSLKPHIAAAQLWEIIVALGFVDENYNPTPKLRTFARKTFGERYFP